MVSPRRAYEISVILIGCGIIFMILPFFKVASEKSEALFFAGLMSVLSGVLLRYLKEK